MFWGIMLFQHAFSFLEFGYVRVGVGDVSPSCWC